MPIEYSDRPFDALADQLVRDQLSAEPVLGTQLGLTDYDAALPDRSQDAILARERAEDAWLDRFTALDPAELTQDEQVDRDLVVMVLRGRAIRRDWLGWRRSPEWYAGSILEGAHLLLLYRLRPDPLLAEALAERLRAAPMLLEQGLANLDPELVAPELLPRAIGMTRAGAGYLRGLAGEPPVEHRAGVAAAGETAGAALDAFGDHLEAMLPVASGGWAIGEQRYDGLLRYAEGLRYGTRELRERGRAAYAELAADLAARTKQLRGHENWQALAAELNADHPSTPAEMLAGYREATAASRAFCVERDLVTLPDGEQCQVLPAAPFNRAVTAVAHYMAPPPFSGSLVGTFFVPYPPDGATAEEVAQRLATNSRAGQWSITAHEAYPGHHWHLAHLAANQRRPLRYIFASTYFTEGWGLYVEEMMKEQGFFTDPYWEFCQVGMRLFRAARIVVDTSLHLGEMSIDEACAFMVDKAALSEGTARAEVLRYCTWPTQAASYLTGAIEIQRMRDEWLHRAIGSLKDFHDTIAGTGRLPISLVERYLGTVGTPPAHG
ncbi:MAG: DUF885 domain-containing protein [Sporichthyaceae bacterium]|nr:DUF885 domain-containing protein [Sporichthyaceae bacterium]